jgi:hypothetical protein
MMIEPKVIERYTIVAPLGLRFCDVATGSFIGEGLGVNAFLKSNPDINAEVFPNRSGVYVLHRARGWKSDRDFINGTDDEDFWKRFPPQADYIIRVVDEMRRFQPFVFDVKLPVRGLYRFDALQMRSPLSPLETNKGDVPLFSTSARPVPHGLTAVRADLWDVTNDRPASWAVLEAYLNGKLLARGVADDLGRTVLMFPYPKLQPQPLSPPLSPVQTQNSSLLNQVWTLELKAKYEPFQTNELSSDLTSLPDLRRTLTGREAIIWEDAEQTVSLREVSLRYGFETIVKTRSALSPPSAERKSALLLSPATSPL